MPKRQSQIRWTRSDYAKLSYVVRQFNNKVNKLQQIQKRSYLPDLKNYQDVKSRIYTRQELNRVMNSLQRFLKEGQEAAYITEGGEFITKWERQELGINFRIASKTLTQQMRELESRDGQPFSRAEMGSFDYREAQAKLQSISNIEQKFGERFKRAKRRLKELGTYDYEMYKAIIYRENYMKAFNDNLSGFEGFELLRKKLNSIQNPIEFYKYITKNSEVLADFFLWYDEKRGFVYNGFASNEEAFKYGLEEIGLIEEEKIKLIQKLKRKNVSASLIRQCEEISSYDELKEFTIKVFGGL